MENIKLLLYCNKQKPYLLRDMFYGFLTEKNFEVYDDNGKKEDYFLNGKIVAECDYEVEDLRIVDDDPLGAYWYETKTLSKNEVLEKSCLTEDKLFDYLGEGNEGYTIHIKNLDIFDEAKELSDYCLYPKNIKGIIYFVLEDTPYILLSVSPEEMCRICNKEQDILVRRKVLKGMI